MIPLDLPPLSVPRMRALQLLADPAAGSDPLAAIVESDPALTAAVLRAANAAAYVGINRVRAAHEAIVRIGFDETRRIVLGAVVEEAFDGVAFAGVDTVELWRHLLATALVADREARRTGHRGEAFTAALLHDIGRLAMATFDPDRYARVVELAQRGVDASRAEYFLFGADHASWGVRVGWEWRLPADIVDAIAAHHDPAAGDPLARALRTGRRVAASLGIGDGLAPGREQMLEMGSPEAALVASLGGAASILDRIEWYRGAVRPAA